MKHNEYHLQKQVCQYLELQYPEVLFMSTGTSLKLTMGQSVRNKAIQKFGFKVPDLVIFEAKGDLKGMFLELKIQSPYKKNGQLKAGPHLEGQNKALIKLREKGYHADFYWSFEDIKDAIDLYIS